MPMTHEAEKTTIAVDPKVRNAAKSAAALEGKGLRAWVEEVLVEASEEVRFLHGKK